MTTIYNTTAGIKLMVSPTEGWLIQNWWQGDTEWKPLGTASKEILNSLRATTIENMPQEVSELFFNEVQARISNEVTALMIETALSNPFTEEQKKKALDCMIQAMIENQGKVDNWPIEEGLEMLGKMAAINAGFGVKMMRNATDEVTIDLVVMELRERGHVAVELHFPCGMKFELVMRHREDHSVSAFAFKV